MQESKIEGYANNFDETLTNTWNEFNINNYMEKQKKIEMGIEDKSEKSHHNDSSISEDICGD